MFFPFQTLKDLARESFSKAANLNPSIDHCLIGKIYLHFNLTQWGVDELEVGVQRAIAEERPVDIETYLLLV
jgi:hypothetical protein